MRKYLDVKNLSSKAPHPFRDAAAEVRESAGRVGAAAESQALLNVALTAVCCAALLVAALLVADAGAGR